MSTLPPTGERTVPGVDREQYFFARHEVVYRWIADRFRPWIDDGVVVDAGAGEGYGCAILHDSGARLTLALEYDDLACQHCAGTYAQPTVIRSNLAHLPLAAGTVDVLVTLQVIEHLWDLRGFLADTRRALAESGVMIASTPNRLTFSPGLSRGERPTNPFHVEEFDAAQLEEIFSAQGWSNIEILGLHHGKRIEAWEQDHGALVAAQIHAITSGDWGQPTSEPLEEFVATVTTTDFTIDDRTAGAQDLIVVGWAHP